MSGKIVFMGTPDFAVESLRQLIEGGIDVAGVITAPDRKSGRGQKINSSPVKVYAEEKGIRLFQPEKLKNPEFIEQLKEVGADLFVVVAFRMLPEIVWNMPAKGTINLHGSLLPNYRGAAPINWAVINGETKTGATTFFLKQAIDTGDIIDKVEIPIEHSDTAGTVHDKLMVEGAALLVNSVKAALEGKTEGTPQENLVIGELKEAPKIFKADCKLDWAHKTKDVHNKIRGLSPYPAAWTEIKKSEEVKTVKIFDSIDYFDGLDHSHEIKVDGDRLYFGTADGWIEAIQIQLEGKRRMSISDFLKGFPITEWKL